MNSNFFKVAILLLILLTTSQYLFCHPIQDSTIDSLEIEKLKAEIELLEKKSSNLESEQISQSGIWERIPSSVVTAAITMIGILIGLWKFLKEQKNQKENEIKIRKLERNVRTEENFYTILKNLGSESDSISASSAVSLLSFIKDEHQDYHVQLFYVYLANLKIEHSKTVNRILVHGFEKIFRKLSERDELPTDIDLSHAYLERINLSGLNLVGCDLAYTNMRYSNLENAILKRIKGYELNLENSNLKGANLTEARLQNSILKNVNFREARLISSDLKNSNLQNAKFQKSKLQSAHLEFALLDGARFQQADLADTFFAKVNEDVLKQIKKGKNWEKANIK